MDNLPTPSSIDNRRKIPLPLVLALSGVFLLFLAFFCLNFFGVFSLSRISPFLTFLPIKTQKPAPAISAKPVSQEKLKISLGCPVAKDFCQQGKVLGEAGESNYGLGFNLPQDTPLLAAFSGTVEDKPKILQRLSSMPFIYLRDGKGNEAVYSFYGTWSVSPGASVTLGQEIGKIGEGKFPPPAPAAGLNFFFALKKDGESQKISPGDFGK